RHPEWGGEPERQAVGADETAEAVDVGETVAVEIDEGRRERRAHARRAPERHHEAAAITERDVARRGLREPEIVGVLVEHQGLGELERRAWAVGLRLLRIDEEGRQERQIGLRGDELVLDDAQELLELRGG